MERKEKEGKPVVAGESGEDHWLIGRVKWKDGMGCGEKGSVGGLNSFGTEHGDRPDVANS